MHSEQHCSHKLKIKVLEHDQAIKRQQDELKWVIGETIAVDSISKVEYDEEK